MHLSIKDVPVQAKIYADNIAVMDMPLEQAFKLTPERGFASAREAATGCMGWIWTQWLLKTPRSQIEERVKKFIERGIEMQAKCPSQRFRAQHDLFLLHCAIFSGAQGLLELVTSSIADVKVKAITERTPSDGERYCAAWARMIKCWIRDDREGAAREFDIVCLSIKPMNFCSASKASVSAWLQGNSAGFSKAQNQTYSRLWKEAERTGFVLSRKGDKTVVTIKGFPVKGGWCWAENGLAILANRRGSKVETDPLWFPEVALEGQR